MHGHENNRMIREQWYQHLDLMEIFIMGIFWLTPCGKVGFKDSQWVIKKDNSQFLWVKHGGWPLFLVWHNSSNHPAGNLLTSLQQCLKRAIALSVLKINQLLNWSRWSKVFRNLHSECKSKGEQQVLQACSWYQQINIIS